MTFVACLHKRGVYLSPKNLPETSLIGYPVKNTNTADTEAHRAAIKMASLQTRALHLTEDAQVEERAGYIWDPPNEIWWVTVHCNSSYSIRYGGTRSVVMNICTCELSYRCDQHFENLFGYLEMAEAHYTPSGAPGDENDLHSEYVKIIIGRFHRYGELEVRMRRDMHSSKAELWFGCCLKAF